jgi:SAM-dependent methyltransferase
MPMLTTFFGWNRRASDALSSRLPHARVNPRDEYARTVARVMNAQPTPAVVADVGGGKSCPFAGLRDAGKDIRIVAVDISADELAGNVDVDEKRVANITRELPFGDGEVDLVVSSSVLEHLKDVEPLVVESHRVLRDGGHSIHLFPGKFAPFAIANQFLPDGVAEKALRMVYPGSEGILGFEAHYDRCYVSAMRTLHERAGFDIADLRVSYYQSNYFAIFLPAFVLSAGYELIVRALGTKDLAAYVLMTARKRPAG